MDEESTDEPPEPPEVPQNDDDMDVEVPLAPPELSDECQEDEEHEEEEDHEEDDEGGDDEEDDEHGDDEDDEDDGAHKGGRRPSLVSKVMQESATLRGVEGKNKRTMYVSCAVDRALTSSKTNKNLNSSQKKRRAALHRLSDLFGGLRAIIGDVAYDTILANDSCPVIQKQFYSRILAAIEHLVFDINKRNEFTDVVRARAVGDDKYYSIAALKEFMAVPVVKKKKADDDSSKTKKKEKGDDDEPKVQPIPDRVKQDMIRDMADTAKTHASSMAARCRKVLSYEVEVDLEARGDFNKDQIKAICAEAKKTLDVVPVVTFATSLGPLGSDDRLVKLVRSYQEQLPTELPANFEPKKPTRKKEPKKSTRKNEPKKSTRKNDEAPLDRIADKIPHVLFKVATFASRRLDTYYPLDERHEDDFEIEDYTKDVEEADEDDEDGVGGAVDKTKGTDVGGDGDVAMKDKHPEEKDAKKTDGEKRKWDRRRPKRFAFLPIWKLSAAMVEYVYSGLAVNWTKDAFDSEPRVDSIAGDLFPDLTFIPQLKYRPGHPKFKHWYLEGFRTNGVELQLRLVCCQGDTPSAFNAANLCKRGYQLTKAKPKVSAKEQVVDSNQKARDMTRFRGTVKLYQDHCDLELEVLPEKIVSVDPGENIPIQVGEISKQVPLKAKGTVDGTATTIESYTTFWNTTRTEYCKSAGYVRQQTFETTRRAESPEYAAALERLRHTRRRTCDPETFAAYARIRGETFEAMRREANRLSRKTRKYHTHRRTQQRLDKIADDLVFGRGVVADSKVLKQRRRQCLRQRRCSWRQAKKSATPEGTDFVPARTTEDDDLKRTKRQKLDSDGSWTDAFATPERLARPVFFGNGSWKSSGIPRKVLVKKISTRGICVITDEYLTSQSCPCCGGRKTLKNIERGSRLRYCTNSRTGTCSLSGFDRDVLGSFNIGLSAIWGLSGKSGRPPHLARLPR